MDHAVKVRFIVLGLNALAWRIVASLSPSIPLTVVGILLVIAITIFYVKQFPMARQTLTWAWLIPFGAGLNFAAMIGNGGMMPYVHVMSSAWWVWLGDWIGGVTSPGDILVVIGIFGILIKLVLAQRTLAHET